MIELLEPARKLTKDLIKASGTLGTQEARYLVDLYYAIQTFRISTNNQIRSIVKSETDEPHETISFFANQFEGLENDIKKALRVYVENQELGKWLLSITGIGEVISAGLLANLNIAKAQTAGAFWRFCGLDPTQEWYGKERAKKVVEEVVGNKKTYDVEDFAKLAQATNWGFNSFIEYFSKLDKDGKEIKKTKTNLIKYLSRVPFNQRMRTLCFKIGESFVKVQNNDNDFYGKLFAQRKAYEQAKNEAGDYAEQAKAKLEKCNIGKEKEAYKWYSQGMLPPGHIHARARRYAVKIFLSHVFDKWYQIEYGKEPPKPFAIAILGHAHKIGMPNGDIQ